MKNWIQPGENLTIPAPADTKGGDGVLFGAIFGVAQGDTKANDPLVLVRRGVFTLPKTAAQAWTAGAKVYWNDTDKVVTTTATGNTLVGAAVDAAANPSPEGVVLLDGAIR